MSQKKNDEPELACLEGRWARWVYIGLILLAYGLLLFEIIVGILPVLACLAILPFALNLAASLQLNKYHAQPSRLRPAIKMTIASTMSHGFILAFVLSVVRV